MLFIFRGSIMKKFIIAFLLLASIHVTAFSISLDELQNAPDQYVKVKENQSYFVDGWRDFCPHGINCFKKLRNATKIWVLVKIMVVVIV